MSFYSVASAWGEKIFNPMGLIYSSNGVQFIASSEKILSCHPTWCLFLFACLLIDIWRILQTTRVSDSLCSLHHLSSFWAALKQRFFLHHIDRQHLWAPFFSEVLRHPDRQNSVFTLTQPFLIYNHISNLLLWQYGRNRTPISQERVWPIQSTTGRC